MENDMPAADAFESMMDSFAFPGAKLILASALIASLCGLFIAITFLQSGLNKLTDYSGNKSYFNSVFEKTFLRSTTAILLPTILILELISGLGCILGIVWMWMGHSSDILGLSLALAGFTLICLLFGQRVAKDYAGASSLTGYFMITILGLFGYAFAF